MSIVKLSVVSAATGMLLLFRLMAPGVQVLPTPAQDMRSSPAGTILAVPPIEELEREIFESVNREREARNLPAVKLSPALAALARKHSQDQAKLGLLGHSSALGRSYPERLEEARIFFAASGENVARSDSFQPGPIHEALMKSEGHRDNVLHPDFDEVGIGIVRGVDGLYYVTQDFIGSVTLLDEETVRSAILGVMDEMRRSRGLPPLLDIADVHQKAQFFAALKSEGKALPQVPEEFGETRVEFYVGPDLDLIAAAMRENPPDRFQMTGVGARFARSPGYPGGAYHICTFLLVGDPAVMWNEEEQVQAVLRTLNEVRFNRNREALDLDPGLSRRAAAIAIRYRNGESELAVPGGRAVAVLYETPKLGSLAPDLRGRVGSKAFRKVGVSVRPVAAGTGLYVNFLVVLLLED